MEFQEKLSNFGYYIENDFYCNIQIFRVSPEAPFNWNLLLIGILSAKGIWKILILQVGGHAPAPPTCPVIRLILLRTEGPRKDFWNSTEIATKTRLYLEFLKSKLTGMQNCQIFRIRQAQALKSMRWHLFRKNKITYVLCLDFVDDTSF